MHGTVLDFGRVYGFGLWDLQLALGPFASWVSVSPYVSPSLSLPLSLSPALSSLLFPTNVTALKGELLKRGLHQYTFAAKCFRTRCGVSRVLDIVSTLSRPQ